MNQNNYNRLNLEQFAIGDGVIIKFKRFPAGNASYNTKNLTIYGKPLCWVLAGDLKLDKYTFANAFIEDIQLYTREGAVDARAKANEILNEERMNLINENPPFQT
jgi:hypothetical protein